MTVLENIFLTNSSSQSPFAARCQNRTYECMISTLHKYPWHAGQYITLGERLLLFNTTIGCIRAFLAATRKHNTAPSLTRQLMQELVCAALSITGFTHQQKAFVCDLVTQAGLAEMLSMVPFPYLGAIGPHWPFEALVKRVDVSMDCLHVSLNPPPRFDFIY